MTAEVNIKDLKEVLRQEIQLYLQYADILSGDSDLMVQLKVQDLEETNKQKATVLLKIQAVEQARQQLVRKIAEEKQMKTEKVKITDLCQSLNPTDKQALLGLRDELTGVILRIKQMQEEATALVRSSLCWIDGSMANLQSLLTPAGTYNARGKVGNPSAFAGHTVENKA